MYVITRSGQREDVNFDKITQRLKALVQKVPVLNTEFVDPVIVTQTVCDRIFAGITTLQIDEYASQVAADLTIQHPDYSLLAARIAIDNLHKRLIAQHPQKRMPTFSEHMMAHQEHQQCFQAEAMAFIHRHASVLDAAICHEQDFQHDYFSFKTLENMYLLKCGDRNKKQIQQQDSKAEPTEVIETPQFLFMRLACGVHWQEDLSDPQTEAVLAQTLETYQHLSNRNFTHATPSLLNACFKRAQMSSCFLLPIKEDSISGIYSTLKDSALISKYAGGIGIHISKVRASGSYIAGTQGHSNGLVPMLRVFNNSSRYVDQGGGKRKGSIAVYLEPWHADVEEFLDLARKQGAEELRARDLFLACWVPDLFMERVESDALWSLFCPHDVPALHRTYGEEFRQEYMKAEEAKMFRRQIPARKLWNHIRDLQFDSGMPFMMFKDACNRKSNQQNLGCITGSNLCTEIVEFCSSKETAVCNLASVCLSQCVREVPKVPEVQHGVPEAKEDKREVLGAAGPREAPVRYEFDQEKLMKLTRILVINLNKIIDKTYYPLASARRSNLRHRPIGIGQQGFADLLFKLRLPYESEEAQRLNALIAESMYYAALNASSDLARVHGTYSSYGGSPISKGVLQQDLWRLEGKTMPRETLDWKSLRAKIQQYGVRNSLVMAPMPTASTSQIMMNYESFEPPHMNIYVRATKAGYFQCMNRYLVEDLIGLKMWTPESRRWIVEHDGSVQGCPFLPACYQELYKTVWEIKAKTLINMAADRGCFIDQSQSFNVFVSQNDSLLLNSILMHGWKKGLKTACYYVRSRPATTAKKILDDSCSRKKNLAKEGGSTGPSDCPMCSA
jgi:ribonucleoside-diphosphate reductase subunit M1